MNITNDSTSLSLRAALDLHYARQELLATNIANADTPGYQPTDLEFEGVLQNEIAESSAGDNSRHMGLANVGAGDTVTRPDVADTHDGNGVDMDREMARATDNSLRYRTTLEIMRRRYAMLRQTISDMSRG